MKKVVFILLAFIVSHTALYAACMEIPFLLALEQSKIQEYKALDKELAEAIKEITKEIKRGHQEIEANSRDTLQDIETLNKQSLLLKEEILHNQVYINELNSILIDAIGESASIKTGKKSLNIIKKELSK